PGGQLGFKAHTVVQYNDEQEVSEWGEPALMKEPEPRRKKDRRSRDKRSVQSDPIELFKLHLSVLREEDKPALPDGLTYTMVITDYLRELRKLIKETLARRWPDVQFPEQVRLIMSLPAEWGPGTPGILRECAYMAGLIAERYTDQLDFTTEPEAAALYCIEIQQQYKIQPGETYLVVDCGGGTVDLTARKLLGDNKLDEATVRTGDLCGSTFVDRAFLNFLGDVLGHDAIEKLRTKNYRQMQYLVHKVFCPRIKFPFSGNPEDFRLVELDIERECAALKDYVTGEARRNAEQDDWLIEIDFAAVKKMFDPVVDQIIGLIEHQLRSLSTRCSAMFLVGGFSESKYLVNRVKEIFNERVPTIAVPRSPIAAVVRGAVWYGLNVDYINGRMLKWTFGIEIKPAFDPKKDPRDKMRDDNRIYKFDKIVERDTLVKINKPFSRTYYPVKNDQTKLVFRILYTDKKDAKYPDEPGMKLLGELEVTASDTENGLNRPVEFSLSFGNMEVKASARNQKTGKIYKTSFNLVA
ncbi:8694_t:CDS:2, partial [Paraglomus occultum]